MQSQFVVQFPLIFFHVTEDRFFESIRKFCGDLLLGSTQNERTKTLGNQLTRFSAVRIRNMSPERGAAAQHARIEEFKDRPQVPGIVFNRGTAERESMIGFQ